MPNWCDNRLEIYHNDPKKISRVINAYNRGELCNEFIPMPNNEWNYEWCWENWGIKWDIGCDEVEDTESDNITLDFRSTWYPPIKLYKQLEKEGYEVSALYLEESNDFAGIYSNGVDDDYDMSERESMPNALIEWFEDMGIDEFDSDSDADSGIDCEAVLLENEFH